MPGLVAGALAAVGYTCASTLLRELSKSVDAAWVATIKAATTAIIFVPILIYYQRRGRKLLPPIKAVLGLLAAAIIVQLAGNLAYQWALGQIGLALVVPLTMGVMVVCSAVGGRMILKEQVSFGLAISLLVLIVSVVLLSFGGQRAGEAIGNIEKPGVWILAGIAAGLAGASFSILGISIRVAMKSPIPAALPMAIVGVVGTILLGAITVANNGWDVVWQSSSRDWALMWGAGLLNSVSFFALTYSLKRVPVIYVNAINVSQVALGAIVGITLFLEPISSWLATGLVVMLIGFIMVGATTNQQTRSI